MQPGELFAGRYRVERTLGSGGMGVVYLVRDERLHRLDALKVMDAGLSHDPTFRERFEREAKAGARFEHPNVVQLRHYDESDGTLYLVMQYVEGRNLLSELSTVGRMSPQRTAEIVRQVAAGLDAAHQAGQVHRDVKPANILLGRHADGSDKVLLTDFGLAQPLSGSQDGLTSAGAMLGTVPYSSPEQLRGEPASVRTDVYALACVAYECLSGRTPFAAGSQVETAEGHLRHAPTLLTVLVPGLPIPVGEAVAAGLAKAAGDRPATAGAFAQRLSEAAGSASPLSALPTTITPLTTPLEPEPAPTQAFAVPLRVSPANPPAPPPAPVPESARHRRGLLVAAAVVLAGFGVGLGAGYADGGSPSRGGASPTATSTAPSADPHAILQRRLPTAVYAGCAADPAREGAGRVAALSCTTPLAGADQLLVTQWHDPAAMAADFGSTSKNRPDGKCGSYTGEPATGLRSTWAGGAALACYINANGAAIVLWEYPQASLQVLAVRKDGDAQAVFAWWTQAVKTPVR